MKAELFKVELARENRKERIENGRKQFLESIKARQDISAILTEIDQDLNKYDHAKYLPILEKFKANFDLFEVANNMGLIRKLEIRIKEIDAQDRNQRRSILGCLELLNLIFSREMPLEEEFNISWRLLDRVKELIFNAEDLTEMTTYVDYLVQAFLKLDQIESFQTVLQHVEESVFATIATAVATQAETKNFVAWNSFMRLMLVLLGLKDVEEDHMKGFCKLLERDQLKGDEARVMIEGWKMYTSKIARQYNEQEVTKIFEKIVMLNMQHANAFDAQVLEIIGNILYSNPAASNILLVCVCSSFKGRQ